MEAFSKLHRRKMLQLSFGATAGWLVSGFGNPVKNTQAVADGCTPTPNQVIGPFYPLVQGEDEDFDLTMIKGHTERAKGEVILVRGRILDEHCEPIANTLVEIWSANTYGRYHHDRDQTPKPLDPNFQGWGEVMTNAKGEYGFRTIKPAAYAFGNPEDPAKWRTPHIHFKVSRRGYYEIITQMYFKGEKLNETDLNLNDLVEADRGQFVIEPLTGAADVPLYKFDLVMKKVPTAEERADLRAALTAFIGKYELSKEENEVKGCTIRQEGDQLYLDLTNYTTIELVPVGKDEVKAAPLASRLVLTRNKAGNVTGFLQHDISRAKPRKPKTWKKTK